jgi:hypothetical protein
MGHRYAGSEPSSDGLVLGSRLQRLALCLPPGGRERGTASVLGFRWHKLERRYTNSTPRYVGLTLGCTLGGGITVFHQGSSNDGTLWYTYSTDGTQWGTDTLVPNLTLTDSPSAVVYNGLLYVFHQGAGNERTLRYLVFDGTDWSGDTVIPNVGMSGPPAAVLWAGGITVPTRGTVTTDRFGTPIPPMAQTGAKIRWFRTSV